MFNVQQQETTPCSGLRPEEEAAQLIRKTQKNLKFETLNLKSETKAKTGFRLFPPRPAGVTA